MSGHHRPRVRPAISNRGSPVPAGARELPALRPYQQEAARAIAASVLERRGETITVEIARQGGKNELSAQIELFLLAAAAGKDSALGAEAVKCAPTFRPQLLVSMRRLWRCVSAAHLAPVSRLEASAVQVGRARITFLSAEPHANVVGHPASLLLEVDEAQDVAPDKFDRDFRPMAAAENATTVLYGTAWDDRTLLERAKQANLEAERRDGVRRHFEYDWQEVARWLPDYGRFVERERQRLGETHPLFLTQYCLKPIAGGGRLLTASQRAQLAGTHARQAAPAAGETYVAGLDLAGADDNAPLAGSDDADGLADPTTDTRRPTTRDATVLTIGRLVYPAREALVQEPRVEVVEHLAWTGEPHESLVPRLVDLLRETWRVTRVAVDATGLGETVARLLAVAMPGRVEPLRFSAESKSRLGFAMLAAVNGGRLKLYAADGSAECREFWRQAERARVAYRANNTMNFFVAPEDGHDDYLMSAALLVHASRGQQRRVAVGRDGRSST